jgi:hypothetical protein
LGKNRIKVKERNQLFDAAAAEYDDVFTDSAIGRLQRDRVYHWLEKTGFFSSHKNVFEINCGTGYDAEQFSRMGHKVIATDASREMINQAMQKRDSSIDFFQLSFEEVASHPKFSNTDILFSNFGGLNCISHDDLKRFASEIALKQSKGDQLIWVLMPKICLTESIYLLLKFQFQKVFRRKTIKTVSVNVDGVKVPTYYHSPKEVRKMLEGKYIIKLIRPVAIILPPSYLESFFVRNKVFLNFLNRMESVFGSMSRLAAWSDHFIIIAEKR